MNVPLCAIRLDTDRCMLLLARRLLLRLLFKPLHCGKNCAKLLRNCLLLCVH